MSAKLLHLPLPADDGIFVHRTDAGVIHLRPIGIRVISFPLPVGSRIVSYELEHSLDGETFTQYTIPSDVGKRFCFTVSRYNTDIPSILSLIRKHYLVIVSTMKRVSDTDKLISEFMDSNTFTVDNAKHFIHVETYKTVDMVTSIDACSVKYILNDGVVNRPAISYASDYPWASYVA